jgi:hypothetical protein
MQRFEMARSVEDRTLITTCSVVLMIGVVVQSPRVMIWSGCCDTRTVVANIFVRKMANATAEAEARIT